MRRRKFKKVEVNTKPRTKKKVIVEVKVKPDKVQDIIIKIVALIGIIYLIVGLYLIFWK
jgi:hypothetical protein